MNKALLVGISLYVSCLPIYSLENQTGNLNNSDWINNIRKKIHQKPNTYVGKTIKVHWKDMQGSPVSQLPADQSLPSTFKADKVKIQYEWEKEKNSELSETYEKKIEYCQQAYKASQKKKLETSEYNLEVSVPQLKENSIEEFQSEKIKNSGDIKIQIQEK